MLEMILYGKANANNKNLPSVQVFHWVQVHQWILGYQLLPVDDRH